jgi:hypothetical protein
VRLLELDEDLQGLVSALRVLGGVQHEAGDRTGSRATLERGLALARRLGHAEETGACLVNLAEHLASLLRWEKTLDAARQSLAVAAAIGNPSGRPARTRHGHGAQPPGPLEEARQAAEAGLADSLALGSPDRIATRSGSPPTCTSGSATPRGSPSCAVAAWSTR